MMAYYEMLKRDYERFEDTLKRIDYLPLGCGALAGVTYNNDREFLAQELGFSNICMNAMDAVSDRDFSLEFLSNSSILIMHLSRLSEELIIWSSSEFGFVEMDDSYSTGSSIMPQKKNPDVAELVRGKTGRIYGNLVGLLTVMKGLPLAYNKDMQEDKEGIFDTVETLEITLQIFGEMLATMKVNKDAMKEATVKGFLNATDMADYLVEKGMEFRNAHKVIGQLVAFGLDQGKNLEEMSLDELKGFSEVFEDDVYGKIDIVACIENKVSMGSTSKKSVEYMIETAEGWLADKQ
jgi:argininosuccinate lyase